MRCGNETPVLQPLIKAATTGGVLVAGVVVTFDMHGTSIVIKRNATTVITATVAELTSEPRHGFLSAAGAARITAATFTP